MGQRLKKPGLTPLVPALQPAEKPGLQTVALRIEEPVARVLSGDDALSKRVTLEARDRPLRDLLPEWGRTLGVKLGASRSTGDDKVTLLVNDRPAGETLTLLAKHLGFQWIRNAGAYELTQDIARQREEEGLRRAELRPIQEQMDFVTSQLKLPKDQLQARLKEIQLRERGADVSPEEKAKLAAERQNVTNAYLGRDVVEASLALFHSLSPAQITALLGGTDLHFSSATGTLPAAIADKVYDSTSILEAQYGALPRLQADATIRLTDVEDEDEIPPPRKGRQFRLRFHYATRRGSKEDLKMWGSEWSPALPALPEPPPTPEALQDPVLNRVVELDVPGPSKPHVHILGGGLIGAAALGEVWPQWATVADFAAALNGATGLEVISDSFAGARIEPNLLRGKRRVGELLQILAAELDYRWAKTGNVVFLRSRRYYAERPAEVPQRVINAFRDRVQAANQLSLDELSALAAAIDDPQARSMFRYWGWYLRDTGILPTDYFYPHREHLRFWASLTPAQRKLAQSGQVLAVNQMTPLQQRLWAAAFTSAPDSARDTATAMRQPTSQEIAAGGFSLGQKQVQNMIWIRTSPDGKQRSATGVMVEGPPGVDVRKFMHFEAGSELPAPSPQESLDGYDFGYHLAGDMQPVRKVRILIPHPRKPRAQ